MADGLKVNDRRERPLNAAPIEAMAAMHRKLPQSSHLARCADTEANRMSPLAPTGQLSSGDGLEGVASASGLVSVP